MLASRLAGQPAIRRAFGAYTRAAGTSAPAEADPPTSMTPVTAGGEKAGLSTACDRHVLSIFLREDASHSSLHTCAGALFAVVVEANHEQTSGPCGRS